MHWVERALDWIYPPKCALCGVLGADPLCCACQAELPPLDEPHRGPNGALDWSSSLYQFEGRAAQAVRRLKYSRVTSLARPMSLLMRTHLDALSSPDVVVPVPIHQSRKRWRGFNQAALLCEEFPHRLVREALMVRVKRTRPQVELDAKSRLTNLRGAFEADPAVKGLAVLLVDDVVTTGGTGVACAEALKQAGAQSVGLLTFCGEKSRAEGG